MAGLVSDHCQFSLDVIVHLSTSNQNFYPYCWSIFVDKVFPSTVHSPAYDENAGSFSEQLNGQQGQSENFIKGFLSKCLQ